MPGFAFNANIPQPNDNPSNSQGQLLTNNQSNNSIWAVDHIGFNITNSGLHQQVRMPAEALPSVQAGFGGLYCNTAGSETNLFYTPDASGNIYQLTRTITASYPNFGTNLAYGAPPAGFSQVGGWTFLPGGLLLQYGLFSKAGALGTSGTIQFPVAFTSAVYSVNPTLIRASSNSHPISMPATAGLTSFQFQTDTTQSDAVYWSAIGK